MKSISRKKIILGAVLVGTVALAGIHTAGARPWGGGGYGCDGPRGGDCGGYGYQQQQQLDEKSVEARDQFLADTVQLRKDIATKRAEKRALMQNDNPDANRVAQLTGELFDLREQLHNKAQESGVEGLAVRGPGSGRGCDGPRGGRFQRQL